MRVIFHLDLDSYFVSAERTTDQTLKNKPVVITNGRLNSIISAASYEAKAQGVYVPMPFVKALKIVPNLIGVKPNFTLYTSLSSKLFELLAREYTHAIEVASIDECYLDATKIWSQYGSPYKLAKNIQRRVLKKLDLPISIGISNNKFAAKMSTQINKPQGITITKPENFLARFGSWPLIKYHGLGEPSVKKLAELNILTIQDLANANEEQLKIILGKNAKLLIAQAQGKGSPILDISHNELKNIGNSITFEDYPRVDRDEILQVLSSLCKTMALRATNRNLVGSVLNVSLKFRIANQMTRQSKQVSLAIPIQKEKDIFRVAVNLFDKLWIGQAINHLGASLGKLENMYDTSYQTNLFEANVQEKKPLQKVVDDVNRKFKNRVIKTGKEFKLDTTKQKKQTRYIESDQIIKHYSQK